MNCCYKCEDRNSDCHTYCEKYKSFRKKRDAELEVIKKSKNKERDMYGYMMHKHAKIKKMMKGD